jgi:hypothetical protein
VVGNRRAIEQTIGFVAATPALSRSSSQTLGAVIVRRLGLARDGGHYTRIALLMR